MRSADEVTSVVAVESGSDSTDDARIVIGDVLKNRTYLLGDKRFHSENMLGYIENDKDQEATNNQVSENLKLEHESPGRRRTNSQPYLIPATGTAMVARSKRRPVRSVVYADPPHNEINESKPYISNGDDLSFQGIATPAILRVQDDGSKYSPTPNRVPFSQGYSNRIYGASNGDLRYLNKDGTKTRSLADGISLKSVESPLASRPEEKLKKFWFNLSISFSLIYGIFVVSLGALIFTSDLFFPDYDIAAIYCLILLIIGFVYIVFILTDIRLYMSKVKKYEKLKDDREEAFAKQTESIYGEEFERSTPPGTYRSGENLNNLPIQPPNHVYCFDTGRHSGNFYLKIGAACFGLGHLVHHAVLVAIHSYYLASNEDDDPCNNPVSFAVDIIYPIYSFVQLFFIFKYSNIVVLRFKGLARLGFMHLISSSLCFWFWTIIRETIGALTIYLFTKDYGYEDENSLTSSSSEEGPEENFFLRTNSKDSGIYINVTNLLKNHCVGNLNMDVLFINFSPYLYPFTIEYSILIVGVFYVMWHNIGKCQRDEDDHSNVEKDDIFNNSAPSSTSFSQCKIPVGNSTNEFRGNVVIQANCQGANSGLFGGMVIFILALISIIVGFISLSTDSYASVGALLSNFTYVAMHGSMLLIVVLAYNQIRKLDVYPHEMPLLDDTMLMICVPAFFMETALTMLATIYYLNVFRLISTILMTIQVIAQTLFIIDGTRRCSNSKQLRRTKPGRGMVTFLIISNVAVWIYITFSVKSGDIADERYEFFGKELWTILGHITLPLMMFYRFHSSVCLADIWKHSYEPSEEHH